MESLKLLFTDSLLFDPWIDITGDIYNEQDKPNTSEARNREAYNMDSYAWLKEATGRMGLEPSWTAEIW